MPLYEYACDRHGSFDAVRPMALAAEPVPCGVCGAAARRVITPPTLFTMSPVKRQAASRNEKSRHEPRVHRAGCSHGHAAPPSAVAAKRERDVEPARRKLQAYTGPRRWVVEHR